MTLLQAIKAAKRITVFNGEMSLEINKKQAVALSKQSLWLPDPDGDTPYWKLDATSRLCMWWPQ